MHFMLLIHNDEERLAKADWSAVAADYAAFNQALEKAGAGHPGQRLQPASAATSVRVANGKTEVLDGPYADTKEQFAGYFTIDVPDLDQAIAWAARCPSAQYGVIEIRPLHDATNEQN